MGAAEPDPVSAGDRHEGALLFPSSGRGGGPFDRLHGKDAYSSGCNLPVGVARKEGVIATQPSRSAPREVAPRKTLGPPIELLRIGNWGSAQSSGLDNRLLTVAARSARLLPPKNPTRARVMGTPQATHWPLRT